MTFKGTATSSRKDNSPQARLPYDLPSSSASKPQRRRRLPADGRSPRAGFGILVRIPFPPLPSEWFHPRVAPRVAPRPFQGGLPLGLGPTDPCPSTVHMETYSASVFCVLRQNNRYYHQDLHWDYTIARRLTPHASSRAPRPPTRSWIMLFTSRPAYHR